MTDPNPLASKEARFVEELKIASKWANMFDNRKDSNTEEDHEPIQTTRKHSKGMPKKANIKSSKAKTSKN